MGWSKRNGLWQLHRDPSCLCAFDADPGNYVKNGSGVSRWNDITGRGNHAYQPTAVNQPTWNEADSSLSGHGSVTPTAATPQMVITDAISIPDPCFCFAITTIPAHQSYNAQLFDGAYSNGTFGPRRLLSYSTTDNKLAIYSSAALFSPGAYASGLKVALILYFSGSSTSAIYVNSATPVAVGSCGTSSIQRLVLGNAPGYSTSWGAPIQYLSWFSGAPTTKQIDRLLRYASNKVGVVIA